MTSRMEQSDHERRIGLFGGTFNPIHLGHLRAALEVLEALGLEEIVFIPSSIPPHKNQDCDDPIAPAEKRLDWVIRAIAPHKNFRVDRIEIDREGPSYLVDTLKTIRDRQTDDVTPVFIVGEDAFAEMGDWRATKELFSLVDFAVMTRPPGQLANLEERFPAIAKSAFVFEDGGRRAWHKERGHRIDLVPITAIDISSSLVRDACRSHRSIRFLVPESIREEIESSGEYGPPPENDRSANN
ncbi:MAG: nicotinate-nucleotide adenylyltransferase [Myxococcales bacterium]